MRPNCYHKTAYHIHQEDHAQVRPVAQGVAEGSHQQGRQKGRSELAISLQKASSTPRKGRIYPGHGDEAFFIHDTVSGRRYWSLRGRRIAVPYTGSHKKVAVYGAIAKDGRQFLRTYDRFDTPTFVEYLERRCRSIVAAVVDRASQDRAKLVRKLAGKQEHQRSRDPPAVEECWHQGKRVLLVPEYYKTFADMCRANLHVLLNRGIYPGHTQVCQQKSDIVLQNNDRRHRARTRLAALYRSSYLLWLYLQRYH